MVEQWNRDGGTVEQSWWNSGLSDAEATIVVEQWNRDRGTLEHLMVEKENI